MLSTNLNAWFSQYERIVKPSNIKNIVQYRVDTSMVLISDGSSKYVRVVKNKKRLVSLGDRVKQIKEPISPHISALCFKLRPDEVPCLYPVSGYGKREVTPRTILVQQI